MLKFVCFKSLKSCASHQIGKNRDYEIMSYGGQKEEEEVINNNNDEVDQSWRHSTQVDILDNDGPVRHHVPNFDVYAKTRTLVRQQTVSLIQHGYYYNNDEFVHSDETISSNSSNENSRDSWTPRSLTSECTCQIGCSCSFRSSNQQSTQIPSSLVTTTTFNSVITSDNSMSSSSSSSETEFYSMQPMDFHSSDVYTCTSEFKSSIDGDLNVYVGERVMVIHMPKKASDQFMLVKSLATQKCGYVPRYCLEQQFSTRPLQI